ncbi:helix-turn-helix transcriptional regulator [Crenobacter intestini]|uniref:AlpA family phage regulatory protein n=1 Tax=Crenobacter intestini TaxID=2563443 RepID=A0A4T0UPH6_9NEIS|nr:AlpA family phage regulatory protein [Crenobacter intestini]
MNVHLQSIPFPRVLRRKQLQEVLGLSCSTIYSRMSAKSKYHDPEFPRPVHSLPGMDRSAVGWLESEVIDYLNKLAKRRAIVIRSEARG